MNDNQRQHDDSDADDLLELFSRTGMVAPMGTLIDEFKTKVDPDTGAAFRKKLRECGTDPAGALRDWVYLVVHGKTFTDIKLEQEKVKRDMLFGKGPIEGLRVRGEVKS